MSPTSVCCETTCQIVSCIKIGKRSSFAHSVKERPEGCVGWVSGQGMWRELKGGQEMGGFVYNTGRGGKCV